jgi:hypothetical protein
MNLSFTVIAVNPGPDKDRAVLQQIPDPTLTLVTTVILDLSGANRGTLVKGDTIEFAGEITAMVAGGIALPTPAHVPHAAPVSPKPAVPSATAVSVAAAQHEAQVRAAEQKLEADAEALKTLRTSEAQASVAVTPPSAPVAP